MNTLSTISIAAILTLLAGFTPAAAAVTPPPDTRTPVAIPEGPLVRAGLWADSRVARPGQVLWVAVSFEIIDDWHIYWPGLNDTGMPPIFDWHLPDGWTVGAPRYPAPIIHETEGGLVDHVLEGTPLVLFPIKVPEEVCAGQAVTISADVEWLVCRVACVPESQRVQTTLAIAPTREPWPVKDFQGSAVIDMARKALPEPLPETGGPIAVALDGTSLVITAADHAAISFYPTETSRTPVAEAASRLEQVGPTVRIALDPASDAPVEGLIVLHAKDAPRRIFSFRIPNQTDEQRDGFALPKKTHSP